MAFTRSQVSYSRIPLGSARSRMFQSNKRSCTVAYKAPEALLEASPRAGTRGAAVSCRVM